ncbi:3-hydroxy-acyl-CoA-dehydrogenase [Collybia nuda]|uniref:3-hydroxy-acyl-CoA-dehydrogenase n=1 Tax=Collybia nuda TaxID=64659 RepID=A0A9P6CFT0_9AGAR|nr:3-hydroxy-acyl-CoA-dehydrogenase [Collybia nuda]
MGRPSPPTPLLSVLPSSSGLGLATVQDLIKDNAYVAILDLSPPPDGKLASSHDQRCIFIKTDITKHDDVQGAVTRTVEWTKETGAVLGGVVNCAGIGRPELVIGSKARPHSMKSWELTMAINLTGTFNLTRLTLQHLVKVPPEEGEDGERGVVIFVSSVSAYEGQAGQTAYAASKGAIRAMTLPMARDLARHHIRVVTIAPSPFTTPLTDQFSEKVRENMAKSGLLYPKRYGIPKEFAATVRWVLECAYVNGESIRLTGGSRVPASL